MLEVAQSGLRTAADVVRSSPVQRAKNGIRYAAVGETLLPAEELERLLGAAPHAVANALADQAFFFVPLALTTQEDGELRVSESYSESLGDIASCHRNYDAGSSRYVFISTRLTPDKFSVAFELFINVAHAFADRVGISPDFSELVWRQALANVPGETSMDAYEARRQALSARAGSGSSPEQKIDERAKTEFLSAAFSDALAIYMLSLALDLEYFELRERDYPLLAPKALAERLRKMAELFPPNPGYEFAIRYRRRGDR